MKKPFASLFACFVLLSLSCKKSSSDNGTATTPDSANHLYDLVKSSFSVSPFDTIYITGLVPLGNLNPPGHVFPTDHMYFYCFTSLPSLNIKSPGNVHVLRVGKVHYNAGLANDHFDYTIMLGSDNSFMYWYHVSELSPRLLTAANNFNTAKCDSVYAIAGSTGQQCYVTLSLAATPDEVLGVAKTSNGLAGMDMGVTISGSGGNPLEFFDTNSRNQLEAKLGRFDGRARRTALPICGEINQDISGTAQGNWVKQGYQKWQEENHIALVKDNVDPNNLVISAGNSMPGLNSGVFSFDTQKAGLINRGFADVKPDGNIYCYTLGFPNFPSPGSVALPNVSVIVRMENGTTLSAEKRNCDCSCTPYIFTANKVTYTR